MSEDTLSIGLSFAAFVLSIVSIKMLIKREKIAHEFDLFREIYEDHMIRGLPQARKNFRIDAFNVPTGIDPFIKELQRIRKDSLYFSFAEPDFYDKLRDAIWLLEDYLVTIEGPVTGDDWQDIEYQVDWRMKGIYQCIKTRF